jgi:hypothetical protein
MASCQSIAVGQSVLPPAYSAGMMSAAISWHSPSDVLRQVLRCHDVDPMRSGQGGEDDHVVAVADVSADPGSAAGHEDESRPVG